MLIGKIKNRLTNKKTFLRICSANGLNLQYELNRREIPVLAEIFENREYADYFPFYQKACILDIGAHYGYFSLFASLNAGPESKILAFEPFPDNFDILTRNITDCGLKNIESFNCALNDCEGRAKIYGGQSVNNSLVEDFGMIDKEQKAVEVDTKTLEQVLRENKLDKIDFLKMDCEGSEYVILENTPALVFDKIITISMEFHDMKSAEFNGNYLIKKLVGYGFKIVKYEYSRTTMGINYGKIIGTKE